MRRIVTAALATVSSLVLLLAYPTSHNGTVSADGGTSDDRAAAAAPSTDDEDGEASADPGRSASGDDGDDGDGDDDATAAATPSASGSSTGSSSRSSSRSSSGSATGSAARTYKGDAVQTRWGVVQVQITVRNGRITAAKAIRHPDENHKDQEINAYALPILDAAVLKAQSASIDSVSGATVTSDGYVQSLQSALDAAHL